MQTLRDSCFAIKAHFFLLSIYNVLPTNSLIRTSKSCQISVIYIFFNFINTKKNSEMETKRMERFFSSLLLFVNKTEAKAEAETKAMTKVISNISYIINTRRVCPDTCTYNDIIHYLHTNIGTLDVPLGLTVPFCFHRYKHFVSCFVSTVILV